MARIGNWSIKKIAEGRKMNTPTNEERYFLYYKGNVFGSILYFKPMNELWARILPEKIRTRYYKDFDKFCKVDICKDSYRKDY